MVDPRPVLVQGLDLVVQPPPGALSFLLLIQNLHLFSVVRASTASIRAKAHEDAFLTMSENDIHEFAKNQAVTKLLCDFYLYHEHHPQKALELCLAVSHLEGAL